MARAAIPALLALLAMACGACLTTPSTPPQRDLIPFHDGSEPGRAPQRVVFVPLTTEDAERQDAERFASALQGSLTKRNLFEVVPVTERDLLEIDLGSTRSRGVFRSEDLVLISRRFGADAVLFGTVSRFRAVPTVQFGARLSLLDCRVGKVRWATDFFLDGADIQVEQDVHNYHDVWLRGQAHVDGHRTLLVAPRLFFEYAATRVVQTLERTLRPPISDVVVK